MNLQEDDHEDDFQGEFENENPFYELQQTVETNFFRALKEGEPLSVFLYVPHFTLSQKVKDYLDIFLLEQAYINLFENEQKEEVVFQDDYISIVIKDAEFKRDLLTRMINYYVEKEEYEKCAKIQKELENLNN